MEPMIKEYILTFIRNLLAPLVILLTPYLSQDAAIQVVTAIASIVVVVVWALANKYLWKKTTEGALKATPTASETTLKNIIASSGTNTTSGR